MKNLLPILLLVLSTLNAVAATFTVTNTNDSGAGSLRQAMINANAMAGADFIVFDPVVFSIPQTITVLSTLGFNSADNLPLTITGPGANLLTISGNDAVHIFTVSAGDTGTLSGVTLTRAVSGAMRNDGTLTVTNVTFHDNTNVYGGAIFNDGLSLTVSGCTFTENEATSGSATGQGGGAIHLVNGAGTVSISDSTFSDNHEIGGSGGGGAIRNRSGTMTITNSTFTGNTAVGGAGAIVNSDIMTITDCTITGNSTTASSGGLSNSGQLTLSNSIVSGNTASASGGGISASGTLTITDSTISNNTATAGIGGGLNLAGTTINVSNTTISGNMAPGAGGDGGGIRTSGSSNLNNLTVSGNSAGRDGAGIYASGTSGNITNIESCTIASNTATRAAGGVWRASTTNPVNLRNSIFANNTDNGTAPDLRGGVVSLGYNLIENITGATITGDTATNITGIDPNLGPLQNNGGPTVTHALLAGSPAVDKGGTSEFTIDQRGSVRSFDNAAISNAAGGNGTDIGAFEVELPEVTAVVSRRAHGAAGAFDINLLAAPIVTECRSGGNYQVIVTFANPVSVSGLSVMSSNGLAGGMQTVNGAVVTVDLTAVANAQSVGITLINANDGLIAGDVFIPLGVLIGDSNGDAVVNSGDASQTRSRSGQAPDGTNFRSDVNADGVVNSGDTSAVRSRSGTLLP